MEIEKAVIENVKVYTDRSYFVDEFDGCHPLDDLWRKRPRLYGDTDVVAIDVKTTDDSGRSIRNLFPVVLKYDGTMEYTTLSSRSRLRRERFAAFLEHYGITDKVDEYSVLEGMKEWKGKPVEVVNYMGMDQIFIPDHIVRDP